MTETISKYFGNRNFKNNPLFATDFYKVSHHKQYPDKTEYIFSNLTARNGKWQNVPVNGVIFMGLQRFIKEFFNETWNKHFFSRPLQEVLDEYAYVTTNALGEVLTLDHIAKLHKLQYLPLIIKGLPEGTFAPYQVPVFTIENTYPEFFWLTNYCETILSNMNWGMSTTATTAAWYKKLFLSYAEKTNPEAKDFVMWQGHDFSMRGKDGLESAILSGTGHLASFYGTDTVAAIADIVCNYLTVENELIGGSVPATEHSVMCAGGMQNEEQTFRRLFTDVHPSGIISIVSDTWDYYKVISEFLPKMRNEIMAREGKVVIRPDSGDPVEIICGMEIATIDDVSLDVEGAKSWVLSEIIDQVQEETPHGEYGGDVHKKYVRWGDKVYLAKAYLEWDRYDKQFYCVERSYSKITSFEEVQLTPEQKGSIECLWETFGGTMSSTGYKVLDSHIGLIYGDSITPQRAWEILRRLEDKGFASTNVVFGIGSYTYQLVTRDTHGFAVKATWAQVDGVRNDIYKSPKTDPGKKSLKGRFDVQLNEETGNLLVTLEDAPGKSQYITYFNNGKYTDRLFSDVRKNVEKSLSHIEVKKPK